MDNSVNKYLLDRAIPLGLCEPWQKLMATGDTDKLLALYRKGIDFCLSNDFPSNADLKRLAGDKLKEYGLHVDSTVTLTNEPFTVLLGGSIGNLSYSGYSASRLFIKHKSQAVIDVFGNAYLDIDCFDGSAVNVVCRDNATVRVAVYGNAHVIATGLGVKVTHKNKKTY